MPVRHAHHSTTHNQQDVSGQIVSTAPRENLLTAVGDGVERHDSNVNRCHARTRLACATSKCVQAADATCICALLSDVEKPNMHVLLSLHRLACIHSLNEPEKEGVYPHRRRTSPS